VFALSQNELLSKPKVRPLFFAQPFDLRNVRTLHPNQPFLQPPSSSCLRVTVGFDGVYREKPRVGVQEIHFTCRLLFPSAFSRSVSISGLVDRSQSLDRFFSMMALLVFVPLWARSPLTLAFFFPYTSYLPVTLQRRPQLNGFIDSSGNYQAYGVFAFFYLGPELLLSLSPLWSSLTVPAANRFQPSEFIWLRP